jgi:hypothetical protein
MRDSDAGFRDAGTEGNRSDRCRRRGPLTLAYDVACLYPAGVTCGIRVRHDVRFGCGKAAIAAIDGVER